MSNLLINKFPELKDEWDFEKNKNFDINTLSCWSKNKVFWKCKKNHSYKTRIDIRARGSNCKECEIDSRRIHDKDKVQILRNKNEIKLNTTKIGDEPEIYITNLLLNTSKIEKIGNTGSSADICITNIDNTINYVQVKTLIKGSKREDHYFVHKIENKNYPDNTLIIMINNERNYFAIDFAYNIKNKGLSLYFNSTKSKYKNIMFNNIDTFLERLIENIPKSSMINNNTDSNIKEIESLKRFEFFCKNLNIKYLRNFTNGNPIDGFINNNSFQAKFKSINNNSLTYTINSYKSAGNLNGKIIHRPYEINDFDFIIIELGGTKSNLDKYKGNFCIIPSNILLEQNIFKTDKIKGKTSFSICPPDYNKKHWSKKYWNNVENI